MKKNQGDVYRRLHGKDSGLQLSSFCAFYDEHGKLENDRARLGEEGLVYTINTV